jgi:ADP-ribose pyrophosphatase YjhB (NUDIX family)
MTSPTIQSRVRLIIPHEDRILLTYTIPDAHYYYIGGRIEYGETIIQAAIREIKEECDATFTFKKMLYVRDFIIPGKEHSIEYFLLGTIDRYHELEHHADPQHPTTQYQSWIPINSLPDIIIYPSELTPILLADAHSGFSSDTKYLGRMQ